MSARADLLEWFGPRSGSGTGTTIAVAGTVQSVCFIHTFGSQ